MLREELRVGNLLLIGLRPASRVFAYSKVLARDR